MGSEMCIRDRYCHYQECFVGITVQDGDNTVHKIIEAGKDCGRGKDPENNGMVLTYESDHCDNDPDDSDDDVPSREDTTGGEKLVCGSDIDSNELSNADDEDDDTIDNGDEETIDSLTETEAVNHIVTPSPASRCHIETLLLTTLLPIIFIIQR